MRHAQTDKNNSELSFSERPGLFTCGKKLQKACFHNSNGFLKKYFTLDRYDTVNYYTYLALIFPITAEESDGIPAERIKMSYIKKSRLLIILGDSVLLWQETYKGPSKQLWSCSKAHTAWRLLFSYHDQPFLIKERCCSLIIYLFVQEHLNRPE